MKDSRAHGRTPGRSTDDHRTENQKVAAVDASMTMAGQPLSPGAERQGQRILRGELSGDQAVLHVLEAHGLGDTPRAHELRRQIAASA